MATEHLKFVIEGDVKEAMSATNQMIHGMDKVGQAVKKLDKEAGTIGGLRAFRDNQIRMRDALAKNDTQLASFNRSIAKTEMQIRRMTTVGVSGMSRLSKSSGAANFAVLSLSQGVQDASFGFIGIQNNITQFIQSFTQLKQETKSTKLAFKALGSTLLGPGGIFLAISAVISAFTYFSMRNRTATKEVDEFKQSIEELSESLQDYGDALATGISNAQKELTVLKLLYNATQDQTLAMQTRLNAARKLQQIYPDILGGLSQEEILAGNAASAYQKLAQNILAVARAQGIKNTITKNSEKQAEIIGKVWSLTNKQKKLTEELTKAQEEYGKALSATATAPGSHQSILGPLQKNVIEAKNNLKETKDQLSQLLKEYEKFGEENINLAKYVNIDDLIKGLKESNKSTEKLSEKIKEAFSVLDAMNAFYEKLKQINIAAESFHWGPEKIQTERIQAAQSALQSLIDNGIDPASEAFRTLQKYFDAFSLSRIDRKIILPDIPKGDKVLNVSSGLNEKGFKGQAGTNTLFTNSKITESIKANAKATSEWAKSASVIEGLFTQIFENAAGGEDVFKSLARAVERLAIKLAAAAATAAVLNALTGGASGALGGFAGIFKGILGFANGGFVQSPTLAVVGDDNTGGEWILNQNQMSALFEGISQARQVVVTGELKGRGNELIGVLNSSQSRNRRIN